MDFERLKTSVKKIEMPDDMRARIIKNCQAKTINEEEKTTMNKNKTVLAAAAVSLCLCFTASAAGRFGFFKDIKNWNGTITGTKYEQASDEIEVNVVSAENKIIVSARITSPDTIPYRELETFCIDSYQIVDMSGNVIMEGERTDFFEIVNGEAKIELPLDQTATGDYKLVIRSFAGSKKADQPLTISGIWECIFSI